MMSLIVFPFPIAVRFCATIADDVIPPFVMVFAGVAGFVIVFPLSVSAEVRFFSYSPVKVAPIWLVSFVKCAVLFNHRTHIPLAILAPHYRFGIYGRHVIQYVTDLHPCTVIAFVYIVLVMALTVFAINS